MQFGSSARSRGQMRPWQDFSAAEREKVLEESWRFLEGRKLNGIALLSRHSQLLATGANEWSLLILGFASTSQVEEALSKLILLFINIY